MLVLVDPELKHNVQRLPNSKGRTVSDEVRGLAEDYVRDRDIALYIDDFWGRIGDKLTSRGSYGRGLLHKMPQGLSPVYRPGFVSKTGIWYKILLLFIYCRIISKGYLTWQLRDTSTPGKRPLRPWIAVIGAGWSCTGRNRLRCTR